jgi:hypothetical protein
MPYEEACCYYDDCNILSKAGFGIAGALDNQIAVTLVNSSKFRL